MVKIPSIAEKKLLGKQYKKPFLISVQQTQSTQTRGSVFAERIELSKMTKFELEMMKLVDCFRDCYGTFDSDSFFLSKTSVKWQFIAIQRPL